MPKTFDLPVVPFCPACGEQHDAVAHSESYNLVPSYFTGVNFSFMCPTHHLQVAGFFYKTGKTRLLNLCCFRPTAPLDRMGARKLKKGAVHA